MFGLYSGRVERIKKVWVDYLTLMLQAPSPTINSSLNFGSLGDNNPTKPPKIPLHPPEQTGNKGAVIAMRASAYTGVVTTIEVI